MIIRIFGNIEASLKKREIIDKIVRQSGLKKKEIEYVVENFLTLVLESVENGDKVEMRGFGTFYRAERKKRQVFSPFANKVLDLPAKSVMAFKASKNTEKKK
jgi:nucleoid DNA-binding protein